MLLKYVIIENDFGVSSVSHLEKSRVFCPLRRVSAIADLQRMSAHYTKRLHLRILFFFSFFSFFLLEKCSSSNFIKFLHKDFKEVSNYPLSIIGTCLER